jgi:hypothetical protein
MRRMTIERARNVKYRIALHALDATMRVCDAEQLTGLRYGHVELGGNVGDRRSALRQRVDDLAHRFTLLLSTLDLDEVGDARRELSG